MNNRKSFIVGIKSIKLTSKEKIFLKNYKPWGVILFTRNIKNIKQTLKLTTSIRRIFNDNHWDEPAYNFSITTTWDAGIKTDGLFGFESKNKFYHITNLEIYNKLIKK